MKDAAKVGFYASLLVVLLVGAFAVCLVLGLFGVDTNTASFGICLFLAFSFLVMIAAVHDFAAPQKKVWTRVATAFAVIYAVMIGICYYVQLAVVRHNILELSPEVLKAFVFEPGSVTFSLDMGLGYFFLTLAPLFLVPIFGRTRLERWLKAVIVLNAALFALPTFIYPLLDLGPAADADSTSKFGSIGLLFWCALFLSIPVLLAAWFRRRRDQPPGKRAANMQDQDQGGGR